MRKALMLFLLPCSILAHAGPPESNPVLRTLKMEDQAARAGPMAGVDWAKVTREDAARRDQLAEILRRGEVRTAEDYYNAALVYQHGAQVEEIRMAYSLALVSATLDPDNGKAKWLTAAAWDRILMRQGKPQWYGTQFQCPHASTTCELYVVDETAVTDDDRKRAGVPPLAESKAKAATLR
ncbi:MAG: hypothetical protein V4508_00215 [Pseudomonadota bacterium]